MNTPNPYAPPPPPPSGPSDRVPTAGTEFSIVEVLSDAWTLANGCKGVFMAVYIGVFGVLWLLQLLFGSLLGIQRIAGSMLGSIGWQVLFAAVLYPFLAGVMTLALRRADGHPVQITDAFSHGLRFGELAVLGVLLTLATLVGFALLFVPGVYLSVALMFALPLVVDRRLGAMDALKTSLRTVHPHWFRCAAFLFALGLIVGVAGLTIIGLVWALPVTSIALALLYRRFFPAPVVVTSAATPVVIDAR